MTERHSGTGLAVRKNGQVAFYDGVKGVGKVLWDPALRVFDGGPDDIGALAALTDGFLEPGKGNDGLYGFTVIDFDTKTIVECDQYGLSLRFSAQEIASLIGYDDPIADALPDYVANGRLGFASHRSDRSPTSLLGLGVSDIEGLKNFCVDVMGKIFKHKEYGHFGYIWLMLPDWRYDIVPPCTWGGLKRQELREKIRGMGIDLPEWTSISEIVAEEKEDD